MTACVALLRAVNVGDTSELFIHCDDGMADSRLRVPCMAYGTVRNLNTVGKLAMMPAAHQ